MRFSFYNNDYERFYLYKRPEPALYGQDALEEFEECVNYVGDNIGYPLTKADHTRQARLHTCFSYCSNGVEAFFSGDDRPNCVDLIPSERTSLICLFPEEECEGTTVKGMQPLGPNENLHISLVTAIIAIVIANPCQIIFEILCLLLLKMKVNIENARENCNLLAF